ncbi:MAG: alpha/beta hydrolase [Chitinophagia bacterium]|nr:alpha/beta hydrolase [Chitinophagia bacterium]
MKINIISIITILLMTTTIQAQYQPLYKVIPNQIKVANEEKEEQFEGITIVSKVTEPAFQYFRVKEDNIKRPCVIIYPGGGYTILASGHEGIDIAKFFNSIGVNAMVVKYRIPNDKAQNDKSIAPLQDAQQAILLAKTNANNWGIDDKKIGILGFSAGGHLAASLSSHYADVKIDNPSKVSLRPDFQILIYPVITMKDFGHAGSKENLIGKDPTPEQIQYYSNELNVNEQTPPAFIVHAINDDAVPVQNAHVYDSALKANKVSSTLYLYEKGGHGFGMKNPTASEQWTTPLTAWLQKRKII